MDAEIPRLRPAPSPRSFARLLEANVHDVALRRCVTEDVAAYRRHFDRPVDCALVLAASFIGSGNRLKVLAPFEPAPCRAAKWSDMGQQRDVRMDLSRQLRAMSAGMALAGTATR